MARRRIARQGVLLSAFVAVIASWLVGCTGAFFARSRARQPDVRPEAPPGFGPLNDAQHDLFYLARVVRDTHPAPYGAEGEAAFEEAARRAATRLAGARPSKAALELEAQRFLARLRDAHTGVVLTQFDADDEAPFRTTPYGDDLYITDAKGDQPARLLGTRLVSVNGRTPAELLPPLEAFASCENAICRRHRAARHLTNAPLLRALAGVDVARGWRLRTRREGGREVEYVLPAASSAGWRGSAKAHPVTGRHDEFFWGRVATAERIAYLQINQMYDRRGLSRFGFPLNVLGSAYFFLRGVGTFTDRLDELFDGAARARADVLVVDVRHDRGGASEIGYQLLHYLQPARPVASYRETVRVSELARLSYPGLEQAWRSEPGARAVAGGFEYASPDLLAAYRDPKAPTYLPPPARPFRGRLVVLVGPETFSSGAELATLVRDNRLGLIVGEPTMQRPSSFGDKLFVELPRTGVIASISYKRYERPDAARRGDLALTPDVEIVASAAQLLAGEDPAWDWIVARRNDPAALAVPAARGGAYLPRTTYLAGPRSSRWGPAPRRRASVPSRCQRRTTSSFGTCLPTPSMPPASCARCCPPPW